MFYLRNIVFISIFFVLLIFGSNFFSKYRHSTSFYKKFPEYNLIVSFSKKYKAQTGLELYSYGVNQSVTKDRKSINGVADFGASYYVRKKRTDSISIKEARSILVALTEAFIENVNSNTEIRPRLDVYPITYKEMSISLYFVDENNVDLGSGVSDVYFNNNEVRYGKYDISDYDGRSNTVGKHSTICTETYEEALDIARNDGSLASQTKLFKGVI
jgi:hypothetical protein